jgi:AraC-like DNA-binding protein
MKIIRPKLTTNILVRFFLSYVLFLSFPILIGVYVYPKTIVTLENEILQNNLSMAEQTRNVLDRRLQEIDAMASQLMFNSYVKRFMYFNGPVQQIESTYRMWESWSNLPISNINNNFIYNYYIYYHKSNIIMSPETLYDAQEFYKSYFSYTDFTFDEWMDKVLLSYHLKECLPLKKVTYYKQMKTEVKSVVTYMQTAALGNNSQPLASIVILINGDEMQRMLKQIVSSSSGYVEIRDNNGTVIAAMGTPLKSDIPDPSTYPGYDIQKIGGHDILLSYTKSNYNGWTYIVALPAQEVLQKVSYLKSFFNAFLVLCLVIGIVLACFISYKNAKPIRKITKILKQKYEFKIDNTKNEYDFLRNAISSLIETDESLKEKMQKQLPALKNAFLYRLVKGRFNDINEIESNMSEVRMNIRGSFFVILLMRIDGNSGYLSKNVLKELNTAKLLIQSITREIYEKAYFTDLDEQTLVYLLSFDCSTKEGCTRLTEDISLKVTEQLEQQYNIKLTITAGEVKDSLVDIFYSLVEAQQALDLVMADNKAPVIWYKSIAVTNETFYYPIDVEVRLINIVRAGDREEVEKLLKLLYEKNFIDRNLSYEMKQFLFRELKSTLLKIVDRLPAPEGNDDSYLKALLQNINEHQAAYKKYEHVENMYMQLVDYIGIQKMNTMNNLKQQITAYINENYHDQNLCLYNVASKFNFTEEYLSNFFKNQTGQSFSSYVENNRLAKACELLKEGNINIEEISEEVGYNSSRVFRRAFKRCYGVSPTSYKSVDTIM